uniref:Uncharacterized protein n=1 Tax=viral metagenome TaxID=1070528 RepID=A0A6C0LDL9_9ZZZZ
MDYYLYNFACLITSILMLIILSIKFKEIDLCLILLLAAIFSIIWRSMKIIKGRDTIEKDHNHNHSLKNPFFILDFCFATLAFLCVLFSKQINKKFIILTILIFVLAWILNFVGNDNNDSNFNKIVNTSQTIHFCGHCYVVLIVFITFYLNIY